MKPLILSWPTTTVAGRVLLALAVGVLLIACSGEKHLEPRVIDEALTADFELVSSARVYFGHQSVGGNLIAGIEDLQSRLGDPSIRIGALGSLDVSDGKGVLLHTKVGENEKPLSKCEDFRRILDNELRGDVDIALFKFCYIDFNVDSDVEAIFDTYSKTMDDLKQRYPDIVFIHVTAPLRSVEGGLGVWAREMLGRPNRSKLANVKRNEFNRKLWERYSSDPIFDLAASMSTYPDGKREFFKLDGATFDSMVPAYTDDGGHLNAVGRTYAAADFVQTIAKTIRGTKQSEGPLTND